VLLITDYIRVSAVPISGLLPLGTSATLPSFLGAAGALDFFLGSRKIGADEAHPGMFPKKNPQESLHPPRKFSGVVGSCRRILASQSSCVFSCILLCEVVRGNGGRIFFKKTVFPVYPPLKSYQGNGLPRFFPSRSFQGSLSDRSSQTIFRGQVSTSTSTFGPPDFQISPHPATGTGLAPIRGSAHDARAGPAPCGPSRWPGLAAPRSRVGGRSRRVGISISMAMPTL